MIASEQRAEERAQSLTSEDDQTQDSMLEKQCLGADIKKWHQQQQHICPQEKLFLPSDFTSSEQTKLGLETLGAEELKLRQGEANGALRTLQDPKFGFPELRDEDLYTKNVDQPNNLSDGGKGFHGNLTAAEEAEYVLDSARVQWHRARADMERWQEEVEILGQAFHRAIQGFNKTKTIWTALTHEHENEPGKQAYALKVAGMYQQMGKDAQEQFEKVGGTWPKAGVSLAHHIKSERPDANIDWAASIAEDN
ncbi:hypothetical protein C8R45DRAFT_931325 [Mycena sanguinolenta]|nr:hypothetical protein C8R45DRAFT_931325 [Mycena sanguinolenta]